MTIDPFQETENIWVTTYEGAEISGYNSEHVRKLARDNWNLPEEERFIRIRRPGGHYVIWLPDLLKYMNEQGYGPHQKPQKHKHR